MTCYVAIFFFPVKFLLNLKVFHKSDKITIKYKQVLVICMSNKRKKMTRLNLYQKFKTHKMFAAINLDKSLLLFFGPKIGGALKIPNSIKLLIDYKIISKTYIYQDPYGSIYLFPRKSLYILIWKSKRLILLSSLYSFGETHLKFQLNHVV